MSMVKPFIHWNKSFRTLQPESVLTENTKIRLNEILAKMRSVAVKKAEENTSPVASAKVRVALNLIDSAVRTPRGLSETIVTPAIVEQKTLGKNMSSLKIAAENVQAAQSVCIPNEGVHLLMPKFQFSTLPRERTALTLVTN